MIDGGGFALDGLRFGRLLPRGKQNADEQAMMPITTAARQRKTDSLAAFVACRGEVTSVFQSILIMCSIPEKMDGFLLDISQNHSIPRARSPRVDIFRRVGGGFGPAAGTIVVGRLRRSRQKRRPMPVLYPRARPAPDWCG